MRSRPVRLAMAEMPSPWHFRSRASGLTPRAIPDKLSTMRMVDVHVPTTDGRHLVLPRRTEPTPDQQLLLHQLDLQLPEQPPPRLSAS